ncbi:hypothetical protein H8D83_00590 [Candidatus Woesearchaeota archaeon]|nr:hypothetical protein [Candidatus Woesearchaeota archaeon]MBL7050571.1 hypothetical protein [Candidatus Woesearchaeota archaeon]
MEIKYLGMLFLATLIVFTAGCNQETGPGRADPFIGGTTGLTIEFIEGAPPKEVYDGGVFPFTAVLKIENIGETDVVSGDASVKVSGIYASDFGTTTTDLIQSTTEDLLGSQKNAEGGITEGGIIHLTFPSTGDFSYGDYLSGNMNFPFLAKLCYKYATKADTKICIKENPLSDNKGVCEIKETKTVFNSGAPVQIANFKETARANDKIAFTFDVWHKGTGKLFEKYTTCEDTLTNKDKVYVSIDTGMDGLECTGLTEGTATSGYITLYDGKRAITCTQNVAGSSGDFEKVIEITLDYDYEQEISTNVLVKHAEG